MNDTIIGDIAIDDAVEDAEGIESIDALENEEV